MSTIPQNLRCLNLERRTLFVHLLVMEVMRPLNREKGSNKSEGEYEKICFRSYRYSDDRCLFC